MKTLSEEQLLGVMAWVDGELEGAEGERMGAWIAENAEAREFAASLGVLAEGVRAATASGSASTRVLDVADAVMAAVAPNDLDVARLKRQGRTRAAVVLGALAAFAAGVWLYARPEPEPGGLVRAPVSASAEVLAVDLPPQLPALALLDMGAVQVDVVDTAGAVSLFYVPTGAENPNSHDSVVVWINETESEAN